MDAKPVTIDVPGEHPVSGLLVHPRDATACYVMAHGAGAGMHHAFMASCAEELAQLDVATLRFQFPYMERGSRRTDPASTCHATVRSAVSVAHDFCPALPLFAGGRSFGGRMTSQAQARDPLPGVVGLAFLGFPLHPAKKPSVDRAAHLDEVDVPMLFLQGTRDELASLDLLQAVVDRLGPRARLHLAQDADHSFHVPARRGRSDGDVRHELLQALSDWITGVLASTRANRRQEDDRLSEPRSTRR